MEAIGREATRDTSGAMSSENVELVRTAMQAFNREGIDAIAPGIHPDFETTTPSSMALEPDTYRGMEGIRRWMDAWGKKCCGSSSEASLPTGRSYGRKKRVWFQPADRKASRQRRVCARP